MSDAVTDLHRGDWQQTYTGRAFHALDPRADEVFIEDIAHALALQCRFGGHCRVPYSVAEHSVRVSWLVGRLAEDKLGQPKLSLLDLVLCYSSRAAARFSSSGVIPTIVEARAVLIGGVEPVVSDLEKPLCFSGADVVSGS